MSTERTVYVARQPILNRFKELVGYELLFRRANEDVARISDPDEATSTVVMNAFTELGLARVVGDAPAWINASRSFLSQRLAFALPVERVAIELLEPVVLDEDMLDVLDELRDAGYPIVLDDFVFDPELAPLVRHADIVKLDVLALGPGGVAEQVALLKPYGVDIVAEKVETHEQFRDCLDLGIEMFQGYFFCKPEVLSGRAMAHNRLAMVQLVAAVQDPTIELHALEELVSRDVALSYRLLAYINSAFFGLRRRVDSIGRAVALLGIDNVKRWATMTIFSTVDDKPQELLVTALARARFCELLGPSVGERDHDQLFTLGLFSVVDALMDQPMEELIDAVPFTQDMVRALVAHEGPKGELLERVLAFERGEPDPAGASAGADHADVARLQVEALGWAQEAADEIFERRAGGPGAEEEAAAAA
jgi:EAL and modified HD-GYP domain-containing signal transduction protein